MTTERIDTRALSQPLACDILAAFRQLVDLGQRELSGEALKAVEGLSENIEVQVRNQYDEREDWLHLVEVADDVYGTDGEIEISDYPVISLSEDENGVKGAYVSAWVYVDDPNREEH